MLFLKNLTFFIRTQCTSNTTKKPFFHPTQNHHSAWWFVLDKNQKENPRLANLSTLSTYLIWNPGNCGQFVPWSAPDINVNLRGVVRLIFSTGWFLSALIACLSWNSYHQDVFVYFSDRTCLKRRRNDKTVFCCVLYGAILLCLRLFRIAKNS